jgi:hypothetical protein
MPIKNSRSGGNCPKIAILKLSFWGAKDGIGGQWIADSRHTRRKVGDSRPAPTVRYPLFPLFPTCSAIAKRSVTDG